ncbi:DUF2726 domain-containing protein [Pasteurella oralis]|uniref:DUF2726 domain-containing protein n=1 Tax=Pasteurella oralis TaxID=1071947 RepID=UPI000C7D34EF|nr:DUF2726 domain-containing protein [Pasteurella oralis]
MWQGVLSQFYSSLYPLLGIAMATVVLKVVFILLTKKRKKKNRYIHAHSTILDKPDKLEILSKSTFRKCALMNKSESILYSKLANLLNTQHAEQGFKLFSQVSMGEFIQSDDQSAFALINSKRVDFLIIDKDYKPLVAIEYQGSGHYQRNAIERDMIKKECCRKAAIEYIEFKQHYDDLDFLRISRILHHYHSVPINEEIYANNPNQLAKSRQSTPCDYSKCHHL